jgi:hypothetical protein
VRQSASGGVQKVENLFVSMLTNPLPSAAFASPAALQSFEEETPDSAASAPLRS